MSKTKSNTSFFNMIIRGVGLAIRFSLIAIIVFSLIIKFANLSDIVIKPINQFIKVVAIFIGCYFSLRGNKGYIKGGLVGLLSIVIMFILFSIVGGKFSIGIGILWDLLFGTAIGVVSGIIAVNMKKNS